MKKWLENKSVKVFFVYVLPLIIGGVFSALGSWNDVTKISFWIKVVILVVLLGIYIYTTRQYIKLEKEKDDKIEKLKLDVSSKEKQIETLEKEKQCYSKGTRELSTLCLDSSNSINILSKKVLQGSRTLDDWNFKKVATGICNSVYEMLCEICKPYDDFTVNIMLDDITVTGKHRNVTMIAHKGKYEQYPKRFEEKLNYKKYSTFYAVKLFQRKNTDIKVLTTKEEVNERFVYVDDEHPEYNQYVGIPVVCSGNKMICLLQICAFKNDKLGETKGEILDMIKSYIIPFVQFALLNYKVEKGFITEFSIIKKMEEKNDGEQVNKK